MSSAWKAEARPLYHARIVFSCAPPDLHVDRLERAVGVEPTISTLARSRITTLLYPRIRNYTPGGRDGIRTRGPPCEGLLLSKQVP